MIAIRELLRSLRLTQTAISVWHCERSVARARTDLARALAAHDAARADLAIAAHEARGPEVPEYLRKGAA